MKKWMGMLGCLVLALGLAACKEEEEPIVDVEEPNEQPINQETEEEPVDNEALQEETAKNHLAKLYQILETVGLVKNGATFDAGDEVFGLAYARLVDFNADGIDELVTLVKGSAYGIVEEDSPYNEGQYVLEVWGADDMLFSTDIEAEPGEYTLGFVEFKNGSKGLLEQDAEDGEKKYYIMQAANEFTEAEVSRDAADVEKYFVNEEEVDEAAFAKVVQEPTPGQDIVVSEAGTPIFATFDGTIGEMLSAIYEHYQAYTGIDAILAAGTEYDKASMQEIADYVTGIDQVDALDESLHKYMVAYILFELELTDERLSDKGYYGVQEEVVAERFLEMFGATLQPEKLGFHDYESREEDGQLAIIIYEDGMFYVLATHFDTPMTIRKVQRATDLGKHYYIEVQDTEFDVFGYYSSAEGTGEAEEEFMFKPVEEWPEEARPFATSNIPRYILMRVDEGAPPVFLYIGYRPLTLEEIQIYIETL